MPRTSLTRRVTFAAAHRARRPDWSDQHNVDVLGACAHTTAVVICVHRAADTTLSSPYEVDA